MQQVPIAAQPLDRFKSVLTDAQWSDLLATIERARHMIDARVIWNVNSTARGGGVAEMLQSLVAYVRGAGFDCRWAVDRGQPRLLRRDEAAPQPAARRRRRRRAARRRASARIYERTQRRERPGADSQDVRAGDVVLLHDPQTAGLVRPLARARRAGDLALPRRPRHARTTSPRSAWDFLRPYVAGRRRRTSSRAAAFAWEDLDPRAAVRDPAVDRRLLAEEPAPRAGDGHRDPRAPRASTTGAAPAEPPVFTRDGRLAGAGGRARRGDRGRALLPESAPLVTQVSRWDRLKDPVGRARGVRRARRAGDGCAPRARRPRRGRRRRTTPRARRSSRRSTAQRAQLPRRRPARASTSRCCRWTTSRRTPRS